MSLLIIIIALLLERLLHTGHFLYRFNWFPHYLSLMQRTFEKSGLWKSYAGLFLVVLPFLVIGGLLYLLVGKILFGLVWSVIGLFVLLYCFGPRDLYYIISHYFEDEVKGQSSLSRNEVTTLLQDVPLERNVWHRTVTSNIFIRFHEGIFAVIFWFLILGPLGALVYRLVALTHHHSEKTLSESAPLQNAAMTVQGILDWIPVRLLSLIFALVGHFVNSFTYLWNNFTAGIEKNYQLLIGTGLASLELDIIDPTLSTIDENKAALALVDRSLIVFVVVIALFVLGSWIP